MRTFRHDKVGVIGMRSERIVTEIGEFIAEFGNMGDRVFEYIPISNPTPDIEMFFFHQHQRNVIGRKGDSTAASGGFRSEDKGRILVGFGHSQIGKSEIIRQWGQTSDPTDMTLGISRRCCATVLPHYCEIPTDYLASITPNLLAHCNFTLEYECPLNARQSFPRSFGGVVHRIDLLMRVTGIDSSSGESSKRSDRQKNVQNQLRLAKLFFGMAALLVGVIGIVVAWVRVERASLAISLSVLFASSALYSFGLIETFVSLGIW